MLASAKRDLMLVAYAFAGALLSHVPARWCLGQHLAQGGVDPGAYLTSSLALDVRDWLWLFALVPLAMVLVYRAFRRGSFHRSLRAVVVPTSALLFAVVLFVHVAAAQFKIERGIFPTMFDASQAGGDSGFVYNYLQVFLGRFAAPVALAVAVFGALSVVLSRTLRRDEPALEWHWLLASAPLALGLISFVGYGLHRGSATLFSSIPTWRVVESPLVVFFEFGVNPQNVKRGARWLFGELRLPPDDGDGAAWLGLPREAARRNLAWSQADGCAHHPFAMSLDAPVEASVDPQGAALRERLRALSAQLYHADSAPPVIWQIALEGIRGDDVHAVHARAPEPITPNIAAYYRRASAIASAHTYQSGYRTSQGLASLFCGLGTAPYGISLVRDLGNLPLRCVTDVLKDAGFALGQYIGSKPSFDAKHLYANYHGFDLFLSQKDWDETVPRTGWGVPDITVLTQAYEASRRFGDGPQYNFVLSLSNHAPHVLPADFPPELGADVEAAFAASGQPPRAAHLARMSTYAYTDHALGLLVDRIENGPDAARSIIIISADHGVDATYLWRGERTLGSDELAAAHALIPLVVLLPEARLDDASRETVASINALLATMPLSQNDIPLMLLELLSATPELRELAPRWRWHTIGGQRLSPYFQPAAPHEGVEVVGINNQTRLFGVRGDMSFAFADEVARLSLDVDKAHAINPTLHPSAALLARFLEGYAKHCWAAEHVRARTASGRL